MAQSFVIARNYGQNPSPGRRAVELDANVNGEYGNMICEVAGYGQVPSTSNYNTGHMAGIVIDGADNTGGSAGDLSVVVDSFTADLANDGTHPCSQANVGQTVYASSGTTISATSTDGPPAGKLIAYVTDDPQGRPCRVALNCFTS